MKVSAFNVIAHKDDIKENPNLPPALAKLARECLVICDGYKGEPRDRLCVGFFAGAMAIAPEKMDASWAFQVALRGFQAVAEWNGLQMNKEDTK